MSSPSTPSPDSHVHQSQYHEDDTNGNDTHQNNNQHNDIDDNANEENASHNYNHDVHNNDDNNSNDSDSNNNNTTPDDSWDPHHMTPPQIQSLITQLQQTQQHLLKATEHGSALVHRTKQWEMKYHDVAQREELLREELQEALNDNESLQMQNDDSRKQKAKWEQRAEQAEEKLQLLERELDYYSQLERRNEKLRKENQGLAETIEDWKRRQDSWNDSERDYQDKLQALKERVKSLKEQVLQEEEGELSDPSSPRHAATGAANSSSSLHASGVSLNAHSSSPSRSVSRKEYDELEKRLHDTEHELLQVRNQKDMDRLKSLQERNTYLMQHEELKTKLEDQEKIQRVKRELHTVRQAISTLRQTSKQTKEQCAKTLHNMNEEIGSLSHSLSNFINNVPQDTKQHIKYRVVDEVGYAMMQAKVLEDLGLERMYSSLGKEKIVPQKFGHLDVCTQERKRFWGSKYFERRWIVFSSISVSIYQDESLDLLERRESLEGIKLGLGEGFEFFLFFPSKAKVTFRAESKEEQDEWFTFIRHLAVQLHNEHAVGDVNNMAALGGGGGEASG